jgi:hypothetical protein
MFICLHDPFPDDSGFGKEKGCQSGEAWLAAFH